MAVKVFKDYDCSLNELDIALDICSSSLKGLSVIEDFGTVSDSDVAKSLGVVPNSLFIVYKNVEQCLNNLWLDNDSKYTMLDTIQIGVQLIESVKNIHSTGYLHLDIKLANMLISQDNHVVLIDYGKARKFKLANGSHSPDTGEKEWGDIHYASLNAFKN